MNKRNLLPIFLILAGLLGATFALTIQRLIPSDGHIVAIGVEFYNDQYATQITQALHWGQVSPAESYTRVLYAKNIQTVDVQLSLAIGDVNPSGNYFTTGWNYTGFDIAPNQIVPIEFSITISEGVVGVGDFSYTYIVTASEAGIV